MTAPTYGDIASLVPLADEIARVELVAEQDVPEPYRSLLCHRMHMTVTVESFFGERVDVVVKQSRQSQADYIRTILLRLAETKRVVQFGVVRIDLDALPERVKQAILAERIPLGRILIENNILTTIEPAEYLRVSPGPKLCQSFACSESAITYGRIGEIAANGRPAIDVLEVLTPGLSVIR